MKPYPVFLVGLEEKPCVVLGGSDEVARKVEGLLDCDARVTVIAAELSGKLRDRVAAGRVDWIAREPRPGDLDGAFLVIAERQDPETNARIFREARAAGALINVMDDVEHRLRRTRCARAGCAGRAR